MRPYRRPASPRRRRLSATATIASVLAFVFVLSACGTTGDAVASQRVPMECVPFARAVSGIELYGNAADWWHKANGRYQRTQTPEIGGVMVFRRSKRLSYGHVAVVSRVLSPRHILLTHANWVPHRVNTDVPAVDVSPNNDWSNVRVWWPPDQQMGARAYPVHGFILPRRPISTADISHKAGRIIQTAAR